jgi:hypothetical protein
MIFVLTAGPILGWRDPHGPIDGLHQQAHSGVQERPELLQVLDGATKRMLIQWLAYVIWDRVFVADFRGIYALRTSYMAGYLVPLTAVI